MKFQFTVSDNLKDAGLVGLADLVGREAGHGAVVQIGLRDVSQTTAGSVGRELSVLDVSLESETSIKIQFINIDSLVASLFLNLGSAGIINTIKVSGIRLLWNCS